MDKARQATGDVFPARAGMNRCSMGYLVVPRSVPRPRGDEPWNRVLATFGQPCSPPARG